MKKKTKTKINRGSVYRPFSKVMVNSLFENVSGLLEEFEAPLEPEGQRLTMKAGCLGVGTVAVSLPSMNTTCDIVGRSPGLLVHIRAQH